MISCTLTSKGQVTIPIELRKKLELHTGDQLLFELVDHKIQLTKKKNDITAAFGTYQIEKK